MSRQNWKENTMSRTARTLVISAAMAGLLAGTMGSTGCSTSKNESGVSSSSTAVDKHDCKGLNSCKGKGGCNSGDMGCSGKNTCKGKGGCKVA
jgi:hypothetical protein